MYCANAIKMIILDLFARKKIWLMDNYDGNFSEKNNDKRLKKNRSTCVVEFSENINLMS